MKSSKRFWVIMIAIIVLDATFTECKKMDMNKGDVMKREKRSASFTYKSITFATDLALQGTLMAMSVSNPLVGLSGGFIIGALIDVIWPSSSYDAIRANFLHDLNRYMVNYQVTKMKMKLRDYRGRITELFDILQLPRHYLDEWRNSVVNYGFNFNRQIGILQKYNQTTLPSFDYFKRRLLAMNTYIAMDRSNFIIPSDPPSSLAYYREFATIEINLLASELIAEASDNRSKRYILNNLRTRLKSAAKRHYKFVLWAAHKAATKLTLNADRFYRYESWKEYNNAVKSILEEFPIQEWKQLALTNDDGINIRNDETVSLKFTLEDNKWLSCSGSGSKCRMRTCPGIDNPFEAGSQYEYYYKCRGEVFWIFGDGRSGSYIRDCDEVALQYSWWDNRNKGYWLSAVNGNWWTGKYYNTRTCPGYDFYGSKFSYGGCTSEKFTLYIQGKNCGDILQDRDVIQLNDKNGKYVGGLVAGRGGRYDLTDVTGPSLNGMWRIYKLNSLIKSYQ